MNLDCTWPQLLNSEFLHPPYSMHLFSSTPYAHEGKQDRFIVDNLRLCYTDILNRFECFEPVVILGYLRPDDSADKLPVHRTS